MANKAVLVCLLVVCAFELSIAAGGVWDKNHLNYLKQGKDWFEQDKVANALCDETGTGGKQQSPINIFSSTAIKTTEDLLEVNYTNQANASIKFVSNHSLKVENSAIGHVTFAHSAGNKVKYNPGQFHFHSPSEHTIDGVQQDLEMHVVNVLDESYSDALKAQYGQYLVFGVTFSAKKNIENSFIKGLGLVKGVKKDETKDITFNLKDFVASLPKNYFHYKGSFTTPPCTEGVNWLVMSTVVDISKEQLDAFNQYVNVPLQSTSSLRAVQETSAAVSEWCGGVGNHRSTQALNNRIVLHHMKAEQSTQSSNSEINIKQLSIICLCFIFSLLF